MSQHQLARSSLYTTNKIRICPGHLACGIVLTLEAQSLAREFWKTYEDDTETADAFQERRNAEAFESVDISEPWTCSGCSKTKHGHMFVVAVTYCRTWKQTSQQLVFVDAQGDIKEMLNLTDIRWRTGKVRSAACGTTARFHDHMIKDVNSSDGEWRMSGRKISCTWNAQKRPAILWAGCETGRYLARSTHGWSTLKTDTSRVHL